MSIKDWYANQTPREQAIVAFTALAGVCAAGYLFVVEPLVTGTAARQTSITAQNLDLAWMKQQESLYAGASSSPDSGTRQPITEAPYLLLDKAIRAKQISAPERVTPNGSEGARAQFDKVEFDKLLEVLGGLDATYGLSVTTINVSKKSEGLVNTRFTLEVGQ